MLVCLNPYRFPNSIAISETVIVGAAPQGPTSLCRILNASPALPILKGVSL